MNISRTGYKTECHRIEDPNAWSVVPVLCRSTFSEQNCDYHVDLRFFFLPFCFRGGRARPVLFPFTFLFGPLLSFAGIERACSSTVVTYQINLRALPALIWPEEFSCEQHTDTPSALVSGAILR